MRASPTEGGSTVGPSSGISLEQTAVKTVSLAGTMEQEIENPGALVLGSRVLQPLIPQIAFYDLDRTGVRENRARASGLNCAAWMHGDGGGSALNTPGEPLRAVLLVPVPEQGAEVLYDFVVRGIPRCATCPPQFAAGRQFDAIGGKPVSHETRAYEISGFVVVEYSE
jgi:hypothetical protein